MLSRFINQAKSVLDYNLKKMQIQNEGSHHKEASKDKQRQYECYLRAALIRGPQYYSYQNTVLKSNKEGQSNYQIIQKIGRGKYSDVFKCICIRDNKQYVLKILKPIKQQKIKREIKILSQLNSPYIVKLYQILHDELTHCHCLVFQYVKAADYRDLIEVYNAKQIKSLIYQILLGLKHCHSKGIMHRDIKPQNLLIDSQNRTVKIADWGLAQYYLPNTQYNVRVASRHYKGPELLLNNRNYDFSLDIWSLGLVFASFIFRHHTIFRGNDNPDQLNEIMRHFGSNQIQQYIKKYNLNPDEEVKRYISEAKNKTKRSWNFYVNKQNQQVCDTLALNLLDKMLQIDHKKRINVLEALDHPYFAQCLTENIISQ